LIPCAHTMGTPEYDVFRAAEVFASIGFSAIEIICTAEYKCAVERSWTPDLRKQLRHHLVKLNMTAASLTPYLKMINSLDSAARFKCMEEAKEVVHLAHDLQCKGIRMLAGVEVSPKDEPLAASLLVEALGELGEFANPYGVELWVENHMDSLATSAASTVRIVEQINLPNVGIVYDPANLIETGGEPSLDALHKQAPYIRHVHVKDAVWSVSRREAKLLGVGMLDWTEIINRLSEIGFDGYLCHEYERRWAPELPPAEIGMAKGYQYIKQVMERGSL
jgi:sugar phosphate isomerase/epimerase